MKIVIATNPDIVIGSRVGSSVPVAQVVAKLQNDLPELLAGVARKSQRDTSSLDVEVDRGEFPESGDPDIWIKVTDVPAIVHDVQVMPYDKVWRVIIDWFSVNRFLFPSSSFRYDTGDHGMSNTNKSYRSW